MDTISLSYDNCLVPADQLESMADKLEPIIKKIPSLALSKALADTAQLQLIHGMVERKKKHNPAMLIVVGIGGSNLGAQAVYEALYGKQGNQHFPLYFADTVDSDHIHALVHRAEHALKNKRNILIGVISKSGTTTETIANFECFLELLKKYQPNKYHEFVVAITDEGSSLWKLAEQQKFDRLPIDKEIGGRYSVFTAVGLCALDFAQVDTAEFIKGAQSVAVDDARISASIIAYHAAQGKNIHDFFAFDTALESLGKWYRQLMGESLGKDGTGITPTVSIGSTDLHSVGQLYLGGPTDKTTAFIEVGHTQHEIQIPVMKEYDALVPHLQGKTLSVIMKAIVEGTRSAYIKNKIPCISYVIPKKSAFYMGQFMQLKMLEMIMLGYLLDVNPFDQPQVELYKVQTRKILANE